MLLKYVSQIFKRDCCTSGYKEDRCRTASGLHMQHVFLYISKSDPNRMSIFAPRSDGIFPFSLPLFLRTGRAPTPPPKKKGRTSSLSLGKHCCTQHIIMSSSCHFAIPVSLKKHILINIGPKEINSYRPLTCNNV